MGELYNILNPGPEIPVRKSTRYVWEKIWGSDNIRKYHDERTLVGSVTINTYDDTSSYRSRSHEDPCGYGAVAGYGDSWVSTEEAYEYSDGTIIVCAVISQWGGTFASNTNGVEFFLLTPRKEKKAK
jgi:hypothetical protein